MLLLGIFLPFLKIKRIEKFEKIFLSDRKTFTKNSRSRYCASVGFRRGVAQLLNSPSTTAPGRKSSQVVVVDAGTGPGTLVAGVGAAGYRYQMPARRDLC